MDRLTKRCNGVVTYIGEENPYDTGQIAAELNTAACREILERLADYEDTGVTPEGVLWDEKMLGLVRPTDYCSFGEPLCNGEEKD